MGGERSLGDLTPRGWGEPAVKESEDRLGRRPALSIPSEEPSGGESGQAGEDDDYRHSACRLHFIFFGALDEHLRNCWIRSVFCVHKQRYALLVSHETLGNRSSDGCIAQLLEGLALLLSGCLGG
jgi:hypothetical protein